jgi:hypothetical protein
MSSKSSKSPLSSSISMSSRSNSQYFELDRAPWRWAKSWTTRPVAAPLPGFWCFWYPHLKELYFFKMFLFFLNPLVFFTFFNGFNFCL